MIFFGGEGGLYDGKRAIFLKISQFFVSITGVPQHKIASSELIETQRLLEKRYENGFLQESLSFYELRCGDFTWWNFSTMAKLKLQICFVPRERAHD